jgi:hypothetical protein
MRYIYSIEEKSNKNITINDIVSTNKYGFVQPIYILCYNINNDCKYPFLQFMMEKIPFNNFIKEEFSLPSVLCYNNETDLETLALEKVKRSLQIVNCDISKITPDMYKGIIYDEMDNIYLLVNISEIDIGSLQLSRNTLIWFCLPTEIINNKQICNIDINEMTVNLFTRTPGLSILTDVDNKPFILPDVVYTGGERKNVEFTSVFGNIKTQEYNSCSKYYYFYRCFNDAIKEGGWIKKGGTTEIDNTDKGYTHSVSDRLLVDNNYGRYITGGITRYALFIEGKIHVENEYEFALTDEIINTMYPEPCITIAYMGPHLVKPDMLVKEYNSFCPLSFHALNKSLLGEKYIETERDTYMIQ